MRQTKKKSDFELLVEELGEEPVRRLYEAYRLTAAAVYKAAKRPAEVQLNNEPDHRLTKSKSGG